MSYPKTIILQSDKLKKLLADKADLVMEGRQLSDVIIEKEAEIDQNDKDIQVIEATVSIEDLKEKAEAITVRFNDVTKEMEDLKKEMYERMKSVVGSELPDKHKALLEEKSVLENKRNKIGLKIQKFNDKIIPLGQKLMAKYIEDEFDDYDTLRIENGEIVATIFNHIDDAKKRLRNKPVKN